jgi:hypothetical protein
VVWLVFAGWWLALGHLVTAILLAVTIVVHPVRPGTPEARRAGAVANWEGDRAGADLISIGLPASG